MKKRLFALLSVVIVLSLFLTGTASATEKSASHSGVLQPGATVTYTQAIPINIVFIGYSAADIDQAALSAWLPATYSPLVRYPQFYGLPGRDMGLQYNFSYRYIYKNAAFSNQFFGYMKKIGVQKNRTFYQSEYNNQVNNIRNVTNPVLQVDAVSVENWLSAKLALPARSYTIVFVNWYSRPDFQFHVYTKMDEPDPDTLYNFGALRSSRKTIAWGGAKSRLWFFDLSAGPDAWTGNYNVDDADLDGDAVPDYRMPPIWEYAAGGYRPLASLSSDLGMVARFVGIDLLFTTSPLYDPLASAPGYGGRKIAHINMMDDDPASIGAAYINTSLILARNKDFEPYYNWSVNMTNVTPIDAGAQNAFRIFNGLSGAADCWNAYFTPFAELFCYFDANRPSYLPSYLPNDYVAGFHAFNTTDANMGWNNGLLGFADDNWVDGTPSYVFQFDTPGYRAMGYGFTSTTIHEGGHHFGMSHPHDGYDSEFGMDFGSSGPLYFGWAGDESNSVMQYISMTTKFSRFDKDNVYRWETAGYLNWSNNLLDDILAHPGYASVSAYVVQAEANAAASLTAFNAWNYPASALYAKKAYWAMARAATILGIPTPDTMQADLGDINPNVPHEADPIRFPDN